jgi:hypothetical protein
MRDEFKELDGISLNSFSMDITIKNASRISTGIFMKWTLVE